MKYFLKMILRIRLRFCHFERRENKREFTKRKKMKGIKKKEMESSYFKSYFTLKQRPKSSKKKKVFAKRNFAICFRCVILLSLIPSLFSISSFSSLHLHLSTSFTFLFLLYSSFSFLTIFSIFKMRKRIMIKVKEKVRKRVMIRVKERMIIRVKERMVIRVT